MGRRTLLLIISVLLAATGTGLVALYVKGADQRAQNGARLVQVLVLKEDVDSGQSVNGEVVFEPVTADQARGALTSANSRSALLEYAASKLYAGTILRPSMLTEKPTSSATGATVTGIHGLGFTIDVQLSDRAAGLLVAGDQARIYAAGKTGATRTVISSVRVISVGPTRIVTTSSTDQVPTTTVGLDVTDQQARDLVAVEAAGATLYLAVIGSNP